MNEQMTIFDFTFDNTQLYKQAGNSIVCNVLVAILGQLFEDKENVYKEILNKERPYE